MMTPKVPFVKQLCVAAAALLCTPVVGLTVSGATPLQSPTPGDKALPFLEQIDITLESTTPKGCLFALRGVPLVEQAFVARSPFGEMPAGTVLYSAGPSENNAPVFA